MNLYKKISWVIPALLMSTALFAESQDISNYCDPCPKEPPECDPCYEKSRNKPYEQGYEICEGALPKAYNAPARIDICDGWDIFVTASFIYWEVLTDQTDLGIVHFNTVTPNEFEVVKFGTSYEPGFKVGLGTYFCSDDWDLYAQYTRLHATENTSYNPDGKLGLFFRTWSMLGSNTYNLANITGTIKASHKFDLDKIDLELGRSYYVGKNLILRPFIGGSGHWLDQDYKEEFTYSATLRSDFFKNDSWAIGPRFGIGSNWIFYEGFRLFGYGAFSLLYAENDASGNGEENITTYTVNKIERNILRDVEELQIGLGWGSYFWNDRWHFDLSVAYEAQRYSHTNYMAQVAQMRNMDSNGDISSNLVKPGDSFLHGLTISARIDF